MSSYNELWRLQILDGLPTQTPCAPVVSVGDRVVGFDNSLSPSCARPPCLTGRHEWLRVSGTATSHGSHFSRTSLRVILAFTYRAVAERCRSITGNLPANLHVGQVGSAPCHLPPHFACLVFKCVR